MSRIEPEDGHFIHVEEDPVTVRIDLGDHPIPPEAWTHITEIGRHVSEIAGMIQVAMLRAPTQGTRSERQRRLERVAEAWRRGGANEVLSSEGVSRSQGYRLIGQAREAGLIPDDDPVDQLPTTRPHAHANNGPHPTP